MDYNDILTALEKSSHIQNPDDYRVDIRKYNNYVESIKLLREIKDYTDEIDVDNPDELLLVHTIEIRWKADDIDIVEIPERETKIISQLLNKCDSITIMHYNRSIVLGYEIYLDVATP